MTFYEPFSSLATVPSWCSLQSDKLKSDVISWPRYDFSHNLIPCAPETHTAQQCFSLMAIQSLESFSFFFFTLF